MAAKSRSFWSSTWPPSVSIALFSLQEGLHSAASRALGELLSAISDVRPLDSDVGLAVEAQRIFFCHTTAYSLVLASDHLFYRGAYPPCVSTAAADS